MTAAAAIEYGLTTPDGAPGAGVHSAGRRHGQRRVGARTEPYTTTGIFGKSSNVGTLMLAKKVGEKRFADLLAKFGLGTRTESGCRESAGTVLR